MILRKPIRNWAVVIGFAVLGLATASAEGQSIPAPTTNYTLTITLAGNKNGIVTSNPAGNNCAPACSASFASGTKVKLTAKANSGSYLAGWSGACRGTAGCTVTMNSNLKATGTFNVNQTVNVLNHIVIMLQENRGLDHYFNFPPWMTPPDPPAQSTGGACYLDKLP